MNLIFYLVVPVAARNWQTNILAINPFRPPRDAVADHSLVDLEAWCLVREL